MNKFSVNQLPKIIIVDDHRMFREGIKLFIELEKMGQVIGEAENGVSFLSLLENLHPDLIIMDIDMPVLDGLEASKIALSKKPDLKILILSMHKEPHFYSSFIEAGVKGFILKTANKTELELAINQIIKGETYFSQQLLQSIIVELNRPEKRVMEEKVEIVFSPLEREALGWFCKGLSSHEISSKMFKSPKTIESYRSSMLHKTQTRNTLELVLYAIKNKFVTDF